MGSLVLCKTPRVSVFGPHTRESLAEAKWTKVNKSGHYVWAPVNSCSLVSLCFKKRGGRCDHEESPCLFFSSHYRERGRRRCWGGALGSGSPPLPPPFLLFFSTPFSFLSLLPVPLSHPPLSLSPVHLCRPSPPSSSFSSSPPRSARPVFLEHAGGERSMVSSERELHS